MEYGKSELIRRLVNSAREGWTSQKIKDLVDSLWRNPVLLRWSGFFTAGAPETVVAWNNTTKVFSIAPAVNSFSFYQFITKLSWHRKTEIQEIDLSEVIAEGLWVFYFDYSSTDNDQVLTAKHNPTPDEVREIYLVKTIVAWLYWDATAGEAIYFGDERHGSEWNPQIQLWADSVFNGLLVEGMKLTNIPAQMLNNGYDGSHDSDAQIGLTAGSWLHEDIEISQAAMAINAGIPVFWFETSGETVVARKGGLLTFPVHVTGGQVRYNPGGTAVAGVPDGNFFMMHYFATNCKLYPVVGWMGRSQHVWIEQCYSAAETEATAVKAEIMQKSWLYLGTVVFQASRFFPIDAKCRLVGLVTPAAIAELEAIDKAIFTKHGWQPNILPAWYNHAETPLLLTSVQGEGAFYYWQGEKMAADQSYGIGFADVYGMQYGIMHQTLGIVGVTTPWRLDAVDKLMFGAFFWNPDQQKRLYCGYNMYSYELHPNERYQRYFNKPVNHISGLVTTINETPGLEHTVNVTDGEIQSVDIIANITDGENIAGLWGQYMQHLKASKYYLQTGAALRWRIENAIAENVVILDETNEVVYNELTETGYQLTPTTDGQYIAMWLIASLDYFEPLKWVVGTCVSDTVEDARAANTAGTLQALFDATPFFCLDYVVVGRVIAKNIAAAPYYELVEVETYADGDFEKETKDRHVTDVTWDEPTKTLTVKRNDNLPDIVRVLSGIDGTTPHIGENGNWYVGDTDTGIPATGPAGADGTDGTNGTDGADGTTPHIGLNGNWYIGETDTGIPATGPAGADGTDGTNGTDGADGTSAYTYVAYASDNTGTGFSLTPTDALKYRAEIHPSSPLSPPTSTDFAGATWVKYIGDDGEGSGVDEKVKINAGDETTGYLYDKVAAGTNISITPGTGENAGKLVFAVDDKAVRVVLDFIDESLLTFTYHCPVAMKFTAISANTGTPSISPALNTDLAQYAAVTVTVTVVSTVILTGETL